MLDRVMELDQAISAYMRSGQTLLVGGFGRGGTPFSLVERLSDQAETYRDFTLVKNDANEPGLGVGLLLEAGMVRKLVTTHIGLNPVFIDQMNRGEVEVEFVPQGIFAERLRAGGAGIPAFLTDVGIGTVVAEGKPTVDLDGTTYLLERALRGDVALLCADRVDRTGNCWWRGSNANMNVPMGTAARRVIVEAKTIVEVGALAPEEAHLPGIFVDAVVQAQPRRHQASEVAS
jgi:acetate CoA/acetoacetate CoA-transferase alpha subunit